MKSSLSERNIVIVLFVMVLVTFSLAQEDSRKMGKEYSAVPENISKPVTVAEKATPQTVNNTQVK